MVLLFGFVAILAAAGLAGVAFGVVPVLVVFLLDLGLEEVKGLIHVS